MKYKMIDYIKNEATEVETGTCEFCFGTGVQNNDVLLLEDESGKKVQLRMNDWDWGDLTNLYIENLIEFAAWLSEQEFEKELNEYSAYLLIDMYKNKEG